MCPVQYKCLNSMHIKCGICLCHLTFCSAALILICNQGVLTKDFTATGRSKGFTGVRVFYDKTAYVFNGTSTTESFVHMILTNTESKLLYHQPAQIVVLHTITLIGLNFSSCSVVQFSNTYVRTYTDRVNYSLLHCNVATVASFVLEDECYPEHHGVALYVFFVRLFWVLPSHLVDCNAMQKCVPMCMCTHA